MSTGWVVLILVLVALAVAGGIYGVIMYVKRRQEAAKQRKAEDLLRAKEMSDAKLVEALGDSAGGPAHRGDSSPFEPAGKECGCPGGSGECTCAGRG